MIHSPGYLANGRHHVVNRSINTKLASCFETCQNAQQMFIRSYGKRKQFHFILFEGNSNLISFCDSLQKSLRLLRGLFPTLRTRTNEDGRWRASQKCQWGDNSLPTRKRSSSFLTTAPLSTIASSADRNPWIRPARAIKYTFVDIEYGWQNKGSPVK